MKFKGLIETQDSGKDWNFPNKIGDVAYFEKRRFWLRINDSCPKKWMIQFLFRENLQFRVRGNYLTWQLQAIGTRTVLLGSMPLMYLEANMGLLYSCTPLVFTNP